MPNETRIAVFRDPRTREFIDGVEIEIKALKNEDLLQQWPISFHWYLRFALVDGDVDLYSEELAKSKKPPSDTAERAAFLDNALAMLGYDKFEMSKRAFESLKKVFKINDLEGKAAWVNVGSGSSFARTNKAWKRYIGAVDLLEALEPHLKRPEKFGSNLARLMRFYGVGKYMAYNAEYDAPYEQCPLFGHVNKTLLNCPMCCRNMAAKAVHGRNLRECMMECNSEIAMMHCMLHLI